ncbi:MAG: hypothetical protein R3Y56_05205 [Akkermansia sp.]
MKKFRIVFFSLLLLSALALLVATCVQLRSSRISSENWQFHQWMSCCDAATYVHRSEEPSLANVNFVSDPYKTDNRRIWRAVHLLYPSQEWVDFNLRQFALVESSREEDKGLYHRAFVGIKKKLSPTRLTRHVGLRFNETGQGIKMYRSAEAWSFEGRDEEQVRSEGYLGLYWDAEQQYALFTIFKADEASRCLPAQEVDPEAPYSLGYLEMISTMQFYFIIAPSIIFSIAALFLAEWSAPAALRWSYLVASILLAPVMIFICNKLTYPHSQPDALEAVFYFFATCMNAAILILAIAVIHLVYFCKKGKTNL